MSAYIPPPDTVNVLDDVKVLIEYEPLVVSVPPVALPDRNFIGIKFPPLKISNALVVEFIRSEPLTPDAPCSGITKFVLLFKLNPFTIAILT
jgi:hypothetical protein